MVVTVALPLLVALLLELARRRTARRDLEAAPALAPPAWWAWGAVRAAAFVASAAYFAGTSLVSSDAPLLLGDAAGHALVGSALATRGLPHGWIDVVGSGFPIGTHYPPLGFMALAGLVRLGLSPARAIAAVALVAWVVPPLAVVEAARAYGRRPLPALAGALFVILVEPYASFVGGWPVVVRMGLVSQALGTALASVWLASALHERGARVAGVAAPLLVAAHPQIFAGAAVALVAFAAACFDVRALGRLARSLAPAALFAAVLYGPGASLAVPFGWPPGLGWLHVGLPPERALDWLEGALVDAARPPLLTALWLWSLATLVLGLRAPAARGTVVATLVVGALSVSGTTLGALGAPGRAILSVFQPLRMMAILPLLGALAVVLAGHAAVALASRASARWVRAALLASGAMVGLLCLAELAARSSSARAELEGPRRALASGTCEVDGARVAIDEDLRARLRSLSGGRLAIDWPSQSVLCARALGLELSSGVPLARTTAVGAHAGVAWAAFAEALQAPEALGVRWLLSRASAARPGWTVVWTRGPAALLRREGGTDRVGVGCASERWRGREDELRRELFAAMERPGADVLGRLVVLEGADEPLSRSALPPDECDARGAQVDEVPREPGALEATVTSPAPVDVILRESALPAWRVEIDGAPVGYRRVAPGFMAARAPAGTHRVVAEVSLRAYAWSTAGALLVALAIALAPRGALARLTRAASRTPPSSRPPPR